MPLVKHVSYLALVMVLLAASPAAAQDTGRTAAPSGATSVTAPAPSAVVTSQDTTGGTAAAANPLALGNDEIYSRSLPALTMAFVIAVLLESAFSIIFNWRVFLAYVSLRGAKTPIMILVAWLIVGAFEIDVVASLISAYKNEAARPGGLSSFITALILAGGSVGVHNLMHALKFRNERRESQVAARPAPTEAWVAISVEREKAVGDVQVKLRDKGRLPDGAPEPVPIAGTVSEGAPQLRQMLLRSKNRFPANGGYSLKPNTIYMIRVERKDADGSVLTALGGEYAFAPGAIVDFKAAL